MSATSPANLEEVGKIAQKIHDDLNKDLGKTLEPLIKALKRIIILQMLMKAVKEMTEAAKKGDNATLSALLEVYRWFQKADLELSV